MEQKQLIGGWFIYITILVYLKEEKVANIKGIIKSLSSKKDRRCQFSVVALVVLWKWCMKSFGISTVKN
jgi:inosine/xanthosine triphosphate pyrophosphatase family protein